MLDLINYPHVVRNCWKQTCAKICIWLDSSWDFTISPYLSPFNFHEFGSIVIVITFPICGPWSEEGEKEEKEGSVVWLGGKEGSIWQKGFFLKFWAWWRSPSSGKTSKNFWVAMQNIAESPLKIQLTRWTKHLYFYQKRVYK